VGIAATACPISFAASKATRRPLVYLSNGTTGWDRAPNTWALPDVFFLKKEMRIRRHGCPGGHECRRLVNLKSSAVRRPQFDEPPRSANSGSGWSGPERGPPVRFLYKKSTRTGTCSTTSLVRDPDRGRGRRQLSDLSCACRGPPPPEGRRLPEHQTNSWAAARLGGSRHPGEGAVELPGEFLPSRRSTTSTLAPIRRRQQGKLIDILKATRRSPKDVPGTAAPDLLVECSNVLGEQTGLPTAPSGLGLPNGQCLSSDRRHVDDRGRGHSVPKSSPGTGSAVASTTAWTPRPVAAVVTSRLNSSIRRSGGVTERGFCLDEGRKRQCGWNDGWAAT
jgi:hypothetical protein